MVRALVIDSDARASRFIVRLLGEQGYSVVACANGTHGLAQAFSSTFDLIVLDRTLPDLDGLSVCRLLRERGIVNPVLMLTERSTVEDRVRALESGVDAFVAKPFEVEEVVARVRALIRRATGFARLTVGPLVLDGTVRAASLDGAPLPLTSREFALLLEFVHHAERVLTRTTLLARVWGTTADSCSRVLDVHISRLRQKFGNRAWMIETVRGAGYRLTATRSP